MVLLQSSSFKCGVCNFPSLASQGRVIDDKCGGLWRVHDKLYDLTAFAKLHPGGNWFIESTKGADITEYFETSHPNQPMVRRMLAKYERKQVFHPRNCPYTYAEDGFYRTLQKRVLLVLKPIPKGPSLQSKMLADSTLLCFLLLCCGAAIMQSYLLAFAAGSALACLLGSAHNFFHQKENFRSLYFDFSLMSSRDWMVSHAMSHHNYPNSSLDIEVSALEPFFLLLPSGTLPRRGSMVNALVMLLMGLFVFPGQHAMRLAACLLGESKLELRRDCLRYLVIALMAGLNPALGWGLALKLWAMVHFSCSIVFIAFTLFAGSHHHDSTWHQGDALKDTDFGINQIDAIKDRSLFQSFVTRTFFFGEHHLHHLFPTVDHYYLPLLQPIFRKTCLEFGQQSLLCFSIYIM